MARFAKPAYSLRRFRSDYLIIRTERHALTQEFADDGKPAFTLGPREGIHASCAAHRSDQCSSSQTQAAHCPAQGRRQTYFILWTRKPHDITR